MNAGNITLDLDIDEVSLNIDTAIPCGLIITELVSNALKYAFPNSRKGKITVVLNKGLDKSFTLIVKDNGVGFPVNFDFNSVKSLGLQLVKVLTNQLDGLLKINHGIGTEVIISFSEMSY
jgi:two-component sensor histidine kinase